MAPDDDKAEAPSTMRRLAVPAVVATAYLLAGLLCFELPAAIGRIVPVWIPSGVALAACVVAPWLAWPGVWLGAFLIASLGGLSPALAALVASTGTASALVGAFILRRTSGFRLDLSTARAIATFVVMGALLTPLLMAVSGAAALNLAGHLPATAFYATWVGWMLAAAVGVLVAAPPILIGSCRPNLRLAGWRAFEAVALLIGLLAATAAAFVPSTTIPAYPLAFMPFPFLTWAALRFGPFGTAVAVAIVALVSIVGSIVAPIGMAGTEGLARVGVLWLFDTTVATTALLLSAFICEYRNAMHRLGESETRYELALAGADDAVWDWNAETGEIVFGERWAAMLGYTLDEVEPRDRAFLRLVHPDDRGPVLNALNAHLSGETPLYESSYRMRNKAGEWQWIMDRARIAGRDAEGRPLRWTGTHKDITELKRAHEALEKAHADLERRVAERTADLATANESLRAEIETREQMEAALRRADKLASMGTLAAGIAHEINNPVGAMLVASELALAEPRDSQRVGDALRLVVRESKRCGAIIQNVLKFARQGSFAKKLCDANEPIRRAVELVGSYARQQNAEVVLALASGLPLVEISEPEIEQVVLNLVQNAVEAGAQVVDVRSESTGDAVRVTVNDDGRGLGDADPERVFDPFYTTRAREGGTGLGLSIAHGLIADHGGTIELHARQGRGASVVFDLPIPAPETAADERTHP